MKKPAIYISLIITIIISIIGFFAAQNSKEVVLAENTVTILPPTPPVEIRIETPGETPKAATPTLPKPPAKADIAGTKTSKSAQIPKPMPPAPPVVEDCNAGSFNTQFLCLINNHRKVNGLNTLSYDGALTAVAFTHSTWMNTNKSMSHTGENSSTFNQRCIIANTSCDAENVAWNYLTAKKLFEAWKNSPGHNKNMLGSHTKLGLSLVGTYATSLFR